MKNHHSISDIKKSILYIIISDIRKPFSDNRIRIFDILISQNAYIKRIKK